VPHWVELMARGPVLGGQVAGFRIESLLAEGSAGSVSVAEDIARAIVDRQARGTGGPGR
jgi:hypothetical protein